MQKYKTIILVSILLLAAVLRFYKLSSVPPSASLDEVTIGYNAYSLYKTGVDEYGSRLPILLRAYDDWRPALYVYFVAGAELLFGPSLYSVRLPSVLFSLGTVLLSFLLCRELFRKAKNIDTVSLLVALLLAISPWHIYISRLGHEVNAGLFFTVLSIVVFIKAVYTKKSGWLLGSALVYALTFYTYQSQKIIVPFLVFVGIVLYWKLIHTRIKELSISVALGSMVVLPMILASFSPGGLIRLKATSAFNGDNPIYQSSMIQYGLSKEKGNVLGILYFHRWTASARIAFSNYVSHFQPLWLFWGDIRESHKVPNLGLLYPWEFPLIIFGMFAIWRYKFVDKKAVLFFVLWFLSSPLPSAITTQAPHAMRSYTFLPTWQILSAFGLVTIFDLLRKQERFFAGLVFSTIIIFSMVYFVGQYYVVFPRTQSDSFQYALHQAIRYIHTQANRYDKIVFSNTDALYQSYMFFLFDGLYDPWNYQKQGGTKSGGFAQEHQFGKYIFRPLHWDQDRLLKNVMFIGNTNDFPTDVSAQHSFSNNDNSIVIKIVTRD